MLEVQRQRHTPNRDHINFTRKVLWTEIAILLLVSGLLTFHGLFTYALAGLLVLMVAVLLIVGMQGAQEWCRVILGLISLLVGIACLLLARFPPEMVGESEGGALGLKLVPIWSGLSGVALVVLAGCLLFSGRIKYASRRLFTLW